MNYGLYLSTSGALAAQARLEVWANNLANVNTTAFKPDRSTVRQRDTARVEDSLPFLPSNDLLEKLGGGVLLEQTRPDLTPAPFQESEAPLDIAIDGPGFLVVDSGKGSPDQRIRLSRDGRLSFDNAGRLVRASDGLPVLDEEFRPIVLDRLAPVAFTSDGRVVQGDATIATLALAKPKHNDLLRKLEGGLFVVNGGKPAIERTNAAVRQFATERSGVDPFAAIIGVTQAESAVGSNARMIQMHYDTLGRAINTLGRIA